MIPTKKISLTLIEYAEPMIENLPNGYSKSDLEVVLKLATSIWNACIRDQWHSTNGNVEAIRRLISRSDQTVPIAIVEALIARKKQLFSDDFRAITNECVVVKDGELVVRAEARLGLQNIPMKDVRLN